MNDLTVLDAMLQRKSIRNFSNEKVNNEIVKEVINHARLAPSSYNAQPWRFVLITNENLIKNLYDFSGNQKQLNSASSVIVLYTDKQDILRNIESLQHPTMTIKKKKADKSLTEKSLHSNPDNILSQGYIALGYLLLGLESKRISSVPMLGFNHMRVKDSLKIEGNILAVIPIGYKINTGHSHHRLPLEKILTFRE